MLSGVKTPTDECEYLYDAKKYLLSRAEQAYYTVILDVLPDGCKAFPQVNLASFIVKNDNTPFRNELFRNVDFLITNVNYEPLFVVEINDQTHLNKDRKERDEKVKNICEEAGIPLVKFWTTYGVNAEYIGKRIKETLDSLPIERVHHFDQESDEEETYQPSVVPKQSYPQPPRAYYPRGGYNQRKSGCYVATCIYGSYDCQEVWVLRRYRDTKLASSWYGRTFIRLYYAVSPSLVKVFGRFKWFHKLIKPKLDKLVSDLREQGYDNTPYNDRQW